MSQKIILASSSPYRQNLLQRLRIPFDVHIPNIDEAALPNEMAFETALRLAQKKARTVAQNLDHSHYLIIGSDQVVMLKNQQLGKPGSFESALKQLQAMRGQTVEFHSAICLFDTHTQHMQTADIITKVQFRQFSDQQAQQYLHIEQPFDVAGSAKAEGLGIILIESIQTNDPTALIGLPLITLTTMLQYAQFPILNIDKNQ